MLEDIDSVLLSEADIAKRVKEMAQEIVQDLQTDASEQPSLIIVPIMTGAMVFVADLIRHLPMYLKLKMITVRSYPGATTTSRPAWIEETLTEIPDSLQGEQVLLVDDILDSGQTLSLVSEIIQARQPDKLRTCVLLHKQRPDLATIKADFVGFDIPDAFVVGYGLDFDDHYRNLPEIVTLRHDVIQQRQNSK